MLFVECLYNGMKDEILYSDDFVVIAVTMDETREFFFTKNNGLCCENIRAFTFITRVAGQWLCSRNC